MQMVSYIIEGEVAIYIIHKFKCPRESLMADAAIFYRLEIYRPVYWEILTALLPYHKYKCVKFIYWLY